ncbi:thymidylate kinase [Sitophilus oryzae]|uniref:Thymidylate kinase n=1 Tax=Sitophilus oryzae TaxID=7048 RepID=A0A6J2XHU4_SITOR|nr:thymidylate kinase [Sitophilus oryzae]XP_030750501.1 thymidylate kinase [Sitophilus oryzae]
MGIVKRGALIVIEGVDRSGKSTQCKRLVSSLKEKNIPAELMCFPDRTTSTGKLISEYLRNKECKLNDQTIHLLFSANRWENFDKMKSLLCNGTNIIVDRYSYSGIAFSSAKNNMDLEWCKSPENGLLKPDLVFLLTLSQEEASKRPGFGDERYEEKSMQAKVSEKFLKLVDEKDNWQVVDASGTLDEVQDVLVESTLAKLEKVSSSPLQYFCFQTK